MSRRFQCLPRLYQSYAVRYGQPTKFQTAVASCALMHTYSGHAISIKRHNSTANSIENTKTNEHLCGIQRDRERAAEMLLAVSGGSSPTSTSSLMKNGRAMVKGKVDSMYQFYDRFSHTNEIREAHEHVERLQEELKETQQKRRDVAKRMNDIRYELQLCYGELASCQKGESRYLELVRKEYEIHHREKQATEEFNLLDKAERDLFIHLQAAVKMSHEKEKIHTNSAKYWSIVGSLLGALLGICGTAFSFYNRNNTITSMLTQVQSEFGHLRDDMEKNRAALEQLIALQRQHTEMLSAKQQSTNDGEPAAVHSKESWLHWIGRTTYVISAYRYFVPRTD